MLKVIKLSAVLLFLIVLNAKAQVNVLDVKKLDKIKNGQTYVLVRGTKFPDADKFLAQMQKGWVLSKGIQYLPEDNTSIKFKPEDSFLSLETTVNHASISMTNITSFYYQLIFWTLKDSYFKKEQAVTKSHHDDVASVYLAVDPGAVNSIDIFKTMDFDGGGVLYNWSPGLVHNYLQQISLMLRKGSKTMILYPITNKSQLDKLATDTLYVPDFNMINYSAFSGKASAKDEVDAANVFEKYTYPYKVITKDVLEKKLIVNDKPFYYLVFIKVGSAKLVYVANSQTGETIYARGTPFSGNFKAGDLKDLFKAIGKE